MVQKRIFIAGVPFWVGLYSESPGDWVAIGEVGGKPIPVFSDSEHRATELWRKEAEANLPKRE